jgi:molybdate transport system substrate-binding protein
MRKAAKPARRAAQREDAMSINGTAGLGLGIVLGLSLMVGGSSAAEIRVLTTLNIRPALDELVGPFERATGNHVTLDSKPAAPTMARVAAGEPGDAVIHSRLTLDRLLRGGKIVQGSIVDVAHASIGVVVKAGAPKPDIATDEKLKSVLLAAPSLAYPDPAQGSMGGNYLADLFERWGIAAALKPKTQLAAGGAPAAELVAKGEAALAINQIAEFLPVKGIEFVTPLPPALTRKVVMAGAILPAAREPKAAMAWLKFLASPAAAAALRAHGMEP